MNLLNAIKEYVAENPLVKAKEIAKHLGVKCKEVNSLLYNNSDMFNKDDKYQWELSDEYAHLRMPNSIKPGSNKSEERTSARIFIEGIDLFGRIKNILESGDNLALDDIAFSLDEPYESVMRVLSAYPDVFKKYNDVHWCVRKDYDDLTCDADFGDLKQMPPQKGIVQVSSYDDRRTDPQMEIVEARIESNFLVLAPPGTGKTYTLIERLIYVTETIDKDIIPGEILVLSFTRAAVAQIRQRIAARILNGGPLGLRYVRVMTFDSYATWLLNDGGYDLNHKGYDERINLLVDELRYGKLLQQTHRISRSHYLFVDEIQDLVGIRASMVFELIKRILTLKGSVTLLGDPHQSLNEYQVRANGDGSYEFIEKVNNLLLDKLKRVGLGVSYRFQTPEMKKTSLEAKKILDSTELSVYQKYTDLIGLVSVNNIGDLASKFTNNLIDALLCRQNREVLLWENWSNEQGYKCSINEGSSGHSWPAWIGFVFMCYQSNVISLKKIIFRANIYRDSFPVPSSDEIEDFLVREKLLRHNIVNLREVAFKIEYLSTTGEKNSQSDGFVISTIHKAKGLEYDNVLIIEPHQKIITDEEVRVLYVAITRAKKTVSLFLESEIPFNTNMSKKKGGHFSYSSNGIKYIQVGGIDDFKIETLFIDRQGAVDVESLERYIKGGRMGANYSISPESCNSDNDHNYALFLDYEDDPVRICEVSCKLKSTLDAMSWGNGFCENGSRLSIANCNNFQSIVHPFESPVLSRYIGPSGIMFFPLIQGFYPITKATGSMFDE